MLMHLARVMLPKVCHISLTLQAVAPKCDGLIISLHDVLSRSSFLKLHGLKFLTFCELQPLSSKLLLQGGNKLLFDFFSLWRTRHLCYCIIVQLVLAYLTLPSICPSFYATKCHIQTLSRVIGCMNAAEGVSEYAAQAFHLLSVVNFLLCRVRLLPIGGKPVRL